MHQALQNAPSFVYMMLLSVQGERKSIVKQFPAFCMYYANCGIKWTPFALQKLNRVHLSLNGHKVLWLVTTIYHAYNTDRVIGCKQE